MSSSNVGAEEDEDPPSATRPPSHPHSPMAFPSQLSGIAVAPPPRPPSSNDLTNAKTTLSPATWGHQSGTAPPAAVAPTTSAGPPKVHSSTRRETGDRAEGTNRGTIMGTNSRGTSKEQDDTPNAPSVASASSPSAFRVIRVPDKLPSTSREGSLDPREQPQLEQRERAQNERTKLGGVEPRKEEEEEELDKREEEEETPPPPPTLAPKRTEPILKPIPSPPWASDGFRPDDPPPPRTRAREVGGGDGKSQFGVREGDRHEPGAGRGVGSSRGSGVGRKKLQTEAQAPGRGPHAHTQRARGSISGGMPTLPAASAGAASRQAPSANPYTHPYPYSNPNLQPYPNANAYPYPASYATATGDYLPRRANHTREDSSDSGGRRGRGRGANASATREVHRLSPSASQRPAENLSARQRHHAQAPPLQQFAHQPRYAEEQHPQFHSQHQPQPPSPKRSYGTPPDQIPHPHAPYSNSRNQQYQQPQPQARVVATSYNPAPSSPRKRTRSQSPFHLAPPPPPPWYTQAETQAHAQGFAHAPARGSMSGAVASLRNSGSSAVLEAVARSAGMRTRGSGAVYTSLDLSPSPPAVLGEYAHRFTRHAGSATRNLSRSRSRGRNRGLARGRSISRGRSRSTTSSSMSSRGRNSRMQRASGSRPRPVFGPADQRARARQSGSEMDVDEEPIVPSWIRKGKGKEREHDGYPAQKRYRSASLSPMREDTGATAFAAPRRAHPDAYQHPPRRIDTGRLPPPAPELRPAWEPAMRSPPAPAPTRTTSQAQAQGATSPSATSVHYDYDYAIEHSPPAAAYATLQEERDERREYSHPGPPPPSPAYRPLSPPPPERRTIAQPLRMHRSRSRSMERGGYTPYGPPSTRNPYYALSSSAPMGVQSYAYLAAQPRQFLPPPSEAAPPASQREHAYDGRAKKDGQEQGQPPSPMLIRRSMASPAQEAAEAFARGHPVPTQTRPVPSRSVNPRRGFSRGGSPARQPQQNKQIQHQSQYQYSQHQPLPASGRYSSFTPQQVMQPTEEQTRQQRRHDLELQQSNMPPNQQPIRPRPPSSSGHLQPAHHRVIVPAPVAGPSSPTSPMAPGPSSSRQGGAPAASASTLSSASSQARARSPSSAQTPSYHPHPQWQTPQPPTPPPLPQAKPRIPRVRKPPPPKMPGMSEFDRPHPNPTVSMRTIPQPPPQLVAQQLAAQLGIPMGSTDLRGAIASTTATAATGSASGTGNGSQGASGSAAGTVTTAGMSVGSGLGGDSILPPDLQVGAHLTQAADAARLAQKVQKAKHRKSQSAQSTGDGASSSHPYKLTSSTTTSAAAAAAGPSTVAPEQAPMQFGPLQHFQTTLFPQEHLLLDMHSVGGAQFVLKPPRNVKGGRGVYGSYGVVLDGVTGVPLNVGSIIGVDAGPSAERSRGAGVGATTAGGSGPSAKNGGRKGGAGGTGGGSAGSHAEPGDESGALLHNVLVVKRRRVPGSQELAAPDPAAGVPPVAGGRLMTPPPVEGRLRGGHMSAVAATAASTAVFLAASEGKGKARGRPRGASSWAAGKGKEREEGMVRDRRLSTSSQALGTAEAPLPISDDDESHFLKTSPSKNTNSTRKPSRSPDAPPIQVHVEDSPSNGNDALDDSDSQSEEEDELESEDSNGGLRYIHAAQHTQAHMASALFSPAPAAPPRRSTRTSSAPSTSRSSSNTRSVPGSNPETGVDRTGKSDSNKQHNESAQSSRAPGASGSVGESGGTETNTFAAPARPSRKSKKYSCDVCDQIFTRSGDVRRHKDTRHNTEGSGGCRCPFCGRVLTRQDALQRHWDRYCRRKSKRHLDRSRGGQASGMGVYGLMHRSYLDPLPHSSSLGGRLVSNEDEITTAMAMAMTMVQGGGSGGRASTGPSRASSPSGSHSRSSSAYGRRLPNEDEEDGEDEDRMDVDTDTRSAESAHASSSRAEKVSNAQNSNRPNDSGREMSGVE